MSTALPGTPMSVGYHRWLHTARRPASPRTSPGRRLAAAFQAATAGDSRDLAGRDAGARCAGGGTGTRLGAALRRLQAARGHLDELIAPTTAVHGDFWFGNLLSRDGEVTGVVDWESGEHAGWPLRDRRGSRSATASTSTGTPAPATGCAGTAA